MLQASNRAGLELSSKTLNHLAQSATWRLVACNEAKTAAIDDSRCIEVLQQRFGFAAFRPHQEQACRAVLEHQNVLLVMPTGAGKSLCFQLPALVRGGGAIVISPLIALMEDQVAKLRGLGVTADCLHSYKAREESRAILAAYLRGELDFLYLAPERLALTGLNSALARRRASLIAVDEAHCISQWGHDFRPDYRLLGERLGPLRQSPMIALTATATVRVQEDIIAQLGGESWQRFVHGFRRDNLFIEVASTPPRHRYSLANKLLAEPNALPAIVYMPTRRDAEQWAAQLQSRFAAAAYHAGMEGAAREAVQQRFIHGELEVIVATVAFGMGVDKSNVRTVIHASLPSSVEGYYQEIGRAGRDGKDSRVYLLGSYADARRQEFFLQRSYPAIEDLDKVAAAAASHPGASAEALRLASGFDDNTMSQVLDKLRVHGGLVVDAQGQVFLGEASWRQSYLEQRRHREAQLKKMLDYPQLARCRMQQLVEHFEGEGVEQRCGHCDICAPAACRTLLRRQPSVEEQSRLEEIVDRLSVRRDAGVLWLRKEHFAEVPAREFDALVMALVRSGRVEMFMTPSGWRRLRLRHDAESTPSELCMDQAPISESSASQSVTTAIRPRKRAADSGRPGGSAVLSPPKTKLFERLRGWRTQVAKQENVPPYCVMSDKTMLACVQLKPQTEADLLNVPGIGSAKMKRYGDYLLSVFCDRQALSEKQG